MLFSAGKTIDLLLKSGRTQYLEFKETDDMFVYKVNGGFGECAGFSPSGFQRQEAFTKGEEPVDEVIPAGSTTLG